MVTILTPPIAGTYFLAIFMASCFLGILPPVDLRAVCFVRAIELKKTTFVLDEEILMNILNERKCLYRSGIIWISEILDVACFNGGDDDFLIRNINCDPCACFLLVVLWCLGLPTWPICVSFVSRLSFFAFLSLFFSFFLSSRKML